MTLSSLSPATFYLNRQEALPTKYNTYLDAASAIAKAKDDTIRAGERHYIYEVKLIGVTYPKAVYVEAGITPSRGEIEGMQGS